MSEICRLCGGTHRTIDHAGDNVTHAASEKRNMTQKERDALWNALRKSTKLISNGRLTGI